MAAFAPPGVHYVCPRCAIESTLPAFGGAGHFWNVCDDCRSKTYAEPSQPQAPLYSKEDEDLASLFASANFSLTHRPHLWEPRNQPPSYASSSSDPSLSTGTSAYSASPPQPANAIIPDPASTLLSLQSVTHKNHPPVGMTDRRLEDDALKARTLPGALEDQQLQHVQQIVYASAHYTHTAHLVARSQHQEQQQQQHDQMVYQQHAEPYMHDGYAHIRQHFGVREEEAQNGMSRDAGQPGRQRDEDMDMDG